MFIKNIESVSELTSENIFLNINSLMYEPINVSISMAHDTFLRDFMEGETTSGLQSKDLQTIQDYLTSYKEKYKFDSVFFVSKKTGIYYHYKNGIDRFMTKDNPENQWYYDFLQNPLECALNVDNDEAESNTITVFVNCKLYDENQNILGIIGVGWKTSHIQEFLSTNEEEYGIQTYLIDKKGNIQISPTSTGLEGINLFKDKVFRDMADSIDTNTTTSQHRWYHSKNRDGYIITKYVPNLNWYLVVEKNTNTFIKEMRTLLCLNFTLSLLLIVIVVGSTAMLIKRYRKKLVYMAETDQLTGAKNRTSYEREIQIHESLLSTYKNFGIGIFDINNLKVINDTYGHQMGDIYIKTISEILFHTFGIHSVYRIGGDEFSVLFLNIDEEMVKINWEKALKEFNDKNKNLNSPLNASFGYAFWDNEHLNTINKIFKSADDAMYQNKILFKKQGSML